MKNNLPFLMDSNGVTVTKLARDIKVSRSTVYRALDGGTPSARFMLKVSKYFKKEVGDIFFDPNVLQIVQRRSTA